jgi:hypothetical protein
MDEDINPESLHGPYGPSSSWNMISLVGSYPILSFLMMAINIYFVVHALRTGRPYYWIWIIFAMPFVGAVAYFLIEMRPRLKRVDWDGLRWQFASPSSRVATLNQLVEASPTIKNRTNLAKEYESQGLWGNAVSQYRECLTGVFSDDARLQIQLAVALLESNAVTDAYQLAQAIAPQRDPILEDDRKFALYRAQCAAGEYEPAIEGLTMLAAKTSSLGPRYYLALAKWTSGQAEGSRKEIDKIVHAYRNGNALFRRSEQPWYIKTRRLESQM